MLKSKIILKVSGKNVERFIRKISNHQIEIIKIRYLNYKTVMITIYEKDYEAVLKLKTIYEIDLVGSSGMIQIKKKIKINQFFIIGLALGVFLLYFLSNVMQEIEIVHTNNEIRTLLLKELEEHGIHKFSMKKNFQELEKIKEEIVTQNREKIEWLEIEAVGTKYVVRVEMRKIEDSKEESVPRNVVARKSAVLKRVDAVKGIIVRNTNDYVEAGDIIISGDVSLNEESKSIVSADGKVYGEVWYKVTVSYPFAYREITSTGKKQTAYTFQFLNHHIQLFPWKIYKTKNVKASTILKHPFLPISFRKEIQSETIEIDEINTEDEAISKAEKKALEKMESQLSDNEKIISQKNLKVEINDSKIVLEIFFTVLEDITSYQNIESENIESSR